MTKCVSEMSSNSENRKAVNESATEGFHFLRIILLKMLQFYL